MYFFNEKSYKNFQGRGNLLLFPPRKKTKSKNIFDIGFSVNQKQNFEEVQKSIKNHSFLLYL